MNLLKRRRFVSWITAISLVLSLLLTVFPPAVQAAADPGSTGFVLATDVLSGKGYYMVNQKSINLVKYYGAPAPLAVLDTTIPNTWGTDSLNLQSVNISDDGVVTATDNSVLPYFIFEAADATNGQYYLRTRSGQYIYWGAGNNIALLDNKSAVCVTTVYVKPATAADPADYVFLQGSGDKEYALNYYQDGAQFIPYRANANPDTQHFNDTGNQFVLYDATTGFSLADWLSGTDYYIVSPGRQKSESDPTVSDFVAVLNDTQPCSGKQAMNALKGSLVTSNDTNWTVTPKDGQPALSSFFFESTEKAGQYYLRTQNGRYVYWADGNGVQLMDSKPKDGITTVFTKDGKGLYVFLQGSNGQEYVLNQFGGAANAERKEFGPYGADFFTEDSNWFALYNATAPFRPATGLEGKSYYMIMARGSQAEGIAVLNTYKEGSTDMLAGENVTLSSDGSVTTVINPEGLPRWTFEPAGGNGRYFIRDASGKYLDLNAPLSLSTKRSVITVYTDGSTYIFRQDLLALNQIGGVGQQQFGLYLQDMWTDIGFRFLLLNGQADNTEQPATDLGGKSFAIVSLGVTENSTKHPDLALTSNQVSETYYLKGESVTLQIQDDMFWVDKSNNANVEEWTFEACDAANGVYYIKNSAGKYLKITNGRAIITEKAEAKTITVIRKYNEGNTETPLDNYNSVYVYLLKGEKNDNGEDPYLNRYGGPGSTNLAGYAGGTTDHGSYFALATVDQINALPAAQLNATLKLFDYDLSINSASETAKKGFQFENPAQWTVTDYIGKILLKDEDKLINVETLLSGEYPNTAKGSLDYLFNGTNGYVATMENGGGLFQKDADGYYYYDSSKNAAWYDPNNRQFVLYDSVIRPNYSEYTYAGNFLPFNQVTGDTVKHYSKTFDSNGTVGYNLTGNDGSLTDVWFGMVLEFDFFIPESGMLNGKPITFNFRGDDDVLVYIDDYLALDISGIHSAREGTIDFANKKVTYEKATSVTEYTNVTKTFEEIFGNTNYMSTAEHHTLRMFYLERGGNISNCLVKFNMPVANVVEVEKQIVQNNGSPLDDSLSALNNLEFTFCVKENAGKNLTGTYFLYEKDSNGDYQSKGTGVTDANGYFTLKNNQKAKFQVAETADSYTVVEKAVGAAWQELNYQWQANDKSGSGTIFQSASDYSVQVSGYTKNTDSTVGDLISVKFTNRLNATPYVIAPETVVIDYGLPVIVDIMANDYAPGATNGFKLASLSTPANGKVRVLSKNSNGTYTEVNAATYTAQQGHYYLEYTPATYLSDVDTVTYSYSEILGQTATLSIVPATSMYYEENFKYQLSGNNESYILFAGSSSNCAEFEQKGLPTATHQETGMAGVAGNSPYGSDPAYRQGLSDSLGTSMYVDTTDKQAYFTYDFTGTGTAIYARTSETSGYLRIRIYNKTTKEEYFSSKYVYIDTKYAVKDVTMYNIPVFSVMDMPYGTYTVTVTVAKPANWYANQNEFYLDGIRVYGPMNPESDNYSIAQSAYAADKESDTTVSTLRSHLLCEQSTQTKYDTLSNLQYKCTEQVILSSDAAAAGPNANTNTQTTEGEKQRYNGYVTVTSDLNLANGIYMAKAYFKMPTSETDTSVTMPTVAKLIYTVQNSDNSEETLSILGSVAPSGTDGECVVTFTPAEERTVTGITILVSYFATAEGPKMQFLSKLEASSITWTEDSHALFTDTNANMTTIGDYIMIGPKQEVYLTKVAGKEEGQAVAFALNNWSSQKAARLMLGMKAPNGSPATVTINGNEITVNNSTDCYYDITNYVTLLNGSTGRVVIQVTSGTVSLTNLKATCYPDYRLLSGNAKLAGPYINGMPNIPSAGGKSMTVYRALALVMGAEVSELVETPIDEPSVDETEPLTIKSASLLLSSDISINFYVADETLEGWEDPYMVFTKAKYDAEGNITGYETETVSSYTEKDGCHVYAFSGITSMEMSSTVTATLYASKNGEPSNGKTVSYSVLTYASNQLQKSADAKLHTLLIDLLNYGAAAQTYWNYNTANLANAGLTAEQQALATQAAPKLESSKALTLNDGASVHFKSASLSLKEKVTINYYLELSEYTGDVNDLQVVISYIDNDGTIKAATVDGSALTYRNGSYAASFSALNAKQMRTVCTAEVFAKATGERISDTAVYSIESYAASKSNDADAALVALINAMMTYGDSTSAYFAD